MPDEQDFTDGEGFQEPELPFDSEIEDPPSFFPLSEFVDAESESSLNCEVQVIGIFERETDFSIQHFVRLSDSQRMLDIVIGAPEAKAILDALEGVVPDRPMTHDLLKAVIERTGCELRRVFIDDIWNDKYYAKLVLQDPEENEVLIDCRPSDAIALALRCGCGVYVFERVFELVHSD